MPKYPANIHMYSSFGHTSKWFILFSIIIPATIMTPPLFMVLCYTMVISNKTAINPTLLDLMSQQKADIQLIIQQLTA
jgi:hypothetical protein